MRILDDKHRLLTVSLISATGIAVVSITCNLYLYFQPDLSATTELVNGSAHQEVRTVELVQQQNISDPVFVTKSLARLNEAMSVATKTNNDIRKLTIELHNKIGQTQAQVDTLVAGMPKQSEPEALEKIAQWNAARDLVRKELRKREQERLMLDLHDDERAVRYHERWLQENQEEIWRTTEELQRIEESGVAALAEYASRNTEN